MIKNDFSRLRISIKIHTSCVRYCDDPRKILHAYSHRRRETSFLSLARFLSSLLFFERNLPYHAHSKLRGTQGQRAFVGMPRPGSKYTCLLYYTNMISHVSHVRHERSGSQEAFATERIFERFCPRTIEFNSDCNVRLIDVRWLSYGRLKRKTNNSKRLHRI